MSRTKILPNSVIHACVGAGMIPHGDPWWWALRPGEVERRRSCLDEAPHKSKGTRSTQTLRAINERRLGTLDQNALDGLHRGFRSVTGGSIGTV